MVYKRFNTKKIREGDPNWERGTWYVKKSGGGHLIHKSLKDAKTEDDALRLEKMLVNKMSQKLGLGTIASFNKTLKTIKSKKDNYIYIIKSNGFYKIGISTNIVDRLKTISKTIIPFETHLVLAVQKDNAADLEKKLHSDLFVYRVKGEWFDLSPNVLLDVQLTIIASDSVIEEKMDSLLFEIVSL